MNSERLHHLLQQADAAPATETPSPAALAAGVRRLSRRRRQRTLVVCAGLVVAITATALWQAPRLSQIAKEDRPARQTTVPDKKVPDEKVTSEPVPLAQPAAEQIQAALAAIEREQQLVDRLLAAERLERAVARTDKLQVPLGLPAADLEQLDRAASALVLAAERKEQRPQLLPAAREDYQLIVLLFPHTPWADLAQDRLLNTAPHPIP